jgi:hypothetical protein
VLGPDDVFHLQVHDGKGILARARENLGVALATEQYAAKIFSNGTLRAGAIEVPGPMTPESASAMARSFVTAVGDWHMPKVLPQGSKWVKDELTPEDAQMLLSRKFAVTDIARWLGLPPHMLGDLDRATFSNIEHQGQEFVTYSLGSWLSLWEFGINTQLIVDPTRHFVEFVRDALVRGDLAARWSAYQIAISTGTVTRNEVRRRENLNALDGLDEPLTPAHLTGRALAAPAPSSPARAERLAEAAAARVLRKEVAAVQRLAVRHAADGDAFAVAVTEFYQKHVALVAESLALPTETSEAYCAGQAAQALAGWVDALDQWGSAHYAAGLAALALEAA